MEVRTKAKNNNSNDFLAVDKDVFHETIVLQMFPANFQCLFYFITIHKAFSPKLMVSQHLHFSKQYNFTTLNYHSRAFYFKHQ